MSYQNRIDEIARSIDLTEWTLTMAWAASEIALDVFSMFFWSALGLCVARTLT